MVTLHHLLSSLAERPTLGPTGGRSEQNRVGCKERDEISCCVYIRCLNTVPLVDFLKELEYGMRAKETDGARRNCENARQFPVCRHS